MKLFSFKTGGEYFGIEANYVYRVLDNISITPVCLMPPCYLGLMYYRGELFDVVHMGLFLGKAGAEPNPFDRIVIIRWSDKKLAIAPGEVQGLIWIDDDSDRENLFTDEGHPIDLVTPEGIWETMVKLPYGTAKI